MYYVSMTDKFLSGWGLAEGKINKLIFVCEDHIQARIVSENAKNRGDMKYICIHYKRPYYNPKRYYVQLKTVVEYPNFYKEGYWI